MMRTFKLNVLATVVTASSLFCCSARSHETREKASTTEKPAHHTETGFRNHPFVETASSKGFLFYVRRVWGSIFVPDAPEGHVIPSEEANRLLRSIQGNKVTWLGQAGFLIQMDGVTILTDPFLTDYASPVPFAGPRRFVEKSVAIDDLPPIDLLIISHNHYDHLDDGTVSRIAGKENVEVVVPLGLGSFFEERGYRRVHELDWEQSIELQGVKIKSHPSIHDSARGTGDRNATLWSSWAFEIGGKKLLFIGDSGYSQALYGRIGREHGTFDYAIVPIGAYEPRELMWMSHATPEEAVAIGVDVRSKTLIASHWGTISSLSDEPSFEPPERFKKAGKEKGFPNDRLWVMKIGETRPL